MLRTFIGALAREGFFAKASLVAVWPEDDRLWLVVRPDQGSPATEALSIEVPTTGEVDEAARRLVRDWDERIVSDLPDIRPWPEPPMAVPMVHGFDPVALTYPIRPSPPSPDVARRNLAGYRAATWAETFLPHALLGIRNRVHAAWLAAPDVIALVVVFDGWEQMEPDSPDVWGTPSGPRWLGMITEMTADGNWWNPWTPDYLGEFYMLISEFDALYADRLRREHPEHFPRNDIYAERRPDPREVELAAAILDRIPPSGPRSPRTAAVTPAGAESVVSVGLIGGALITDLGPAGLLYSWAYGNFLLTPETGRYWQEQAGAEGPLGRPIETTTPGPDGALVTYFEHGFVYWHPDTGFCSEAGGAGRGDVPSADALAWVRTHRPPDPK